LDGPSNDWQVGPGLVDSVRRYWWLVVTAALIGAVVAGAWSSRQPVRYEGVVRVFLDIEGDRTADPARIVSSQAQYLTSPVVLDRAVALIGHRLSRVELSNRLTVEPAKDADLITVRVLDATPEQAAKLADTVVRAYREVVAKQTAEDARRDIAALERRQEQLEREIVTVDEQRRAQPGNARLQAKDKELHALADQVETIRRDAVRSTRSKETVREKAAIPDEPSQPKPKQTAAIGAILALVAASALAWWLHGRQSALDRQQVPVRAVGGGGEEPAELDLRLPLRRLGTRFRNEQTASANGSPAANGSVSGIADFDQIATSVQELFRFLDGPPQRLYEGDLPQLAAEEIAHQFQVDVVAILLDNAGEIQTMGRVGFGTSRTGTVDRGVRHLIEAAGRSGPRLVDHDELARLAQTGLGDQADSIALVPLVRDQVGFGVLLAGRRHTDERVAPLTDHDVHEIADSMQDIMVPYLWAWLLLRSLKLRLRTLQ
jgi:capsular polysaccharide biosynthesis protein